MSIETMVRAIEAEAAAEAAGLIARARAEVEAIVGEAEALEAEQLVAIRAREEPAARAEAARRVNAVRLRLLQRRASLLAERVTAAYATAEARLAALAAGGEPDRWQASLERLAGEALRLAGPGASILARPPDAAALRALATRGAIDAQILADEHLGPGLVVHAPSGKFEIDATMAARLAAARVRLADEVAARVAMRDG